MEGETGGGRERKQEGRTNLNNAFFSVYSCCMIIHKLQTRELIWCPLPLPHHLLPHYSELLQINPNTRQINRMELNEYE